MTDWLSKHQNDLRLADAISVEIKGHGDGRISGYASTFNDAEPDRHGDIVSPGAFSKSLADHRRRGTLPAMLWSHQQESPIGRWLNLVEDRKGLSVEGQFNLSTARGREAFEHAKAGDVSAFSIGFCCPEGGRRYLGEGTWALSEVDLVEISLVATPANRNATVASVKQITSKHEAVEFLRSAGLSKEAARRMAAGGYPALAPDTDAHERAMKLVAQIEAATNAVRAR